MLSSQVFLNKLVAMLATIGRPERMQLGFGRRKVRGNKQVEIKCRRRANVVFWVGPSGSRELFPGRDDTSL